MRVQQRIIIIVHSCHWWIINSISVYFTTIDYTLRRHIEWQFYPILHTLNFTRLQSCLNIVEDFNSSKILLQHNERYCHRCITSKQCCNIRFNRNAQHYHFSSIKWQSEALLISIFSVQMERIRSGKGSFPRHRHLNRNIEQWERNNHCIWWDSICWWFIYQFTNIWIGKSFFILSGGWYRGFIASWLSECLPNCRWYFLT